jgi:hypothetical protein
MIEIEKEIEMEQLETNVAEELEAVIEAAVTEFAALREIQPPTSVVKLAAEAAAKVLLAFERGYQMESGGE